MNPRPAVSVAQRMWDDALGEFEDAELYDDPVELLRLIAWAFGDPR